MEAVFDALFGAPRRRRRGGERASRIRDARNVRQNGGLASEPGSSRPRLRPKQPVGALGRGGRWRGRSLRRRNITERARRRFAERSLRAGLERRQAGATVADATATLKPDRRRILVAGCSECSLRKSSFWQADFLREKLSRSVRTRQAEADRPALPGDSELELQERAAPRLHPDPLADTFVEIVFGSSSMEEPFLRLRNVNEGHVCFLT